ncbi:MAG: hypothetical protein EZS28_026214, partial [Streblomastix strix]
LNEELENKKLKDPEKKELEKELEKDKTDLEKVKEKEKELGLKKKNDNDNDSDPEEEFIEEIERITTIVNYSYLNCFAYLLEGYTTENIKKFYDEFKAWGARKQSLIVGDELIMEFSPDMIRSITYTQTKSFMKLWLININDLLATEVEENNKLVIPTLDDIIDSNNSKQKSKKLDFPTFDFYILKGSLIRKFFKVHTDIFGKRYYDLVEECSDLSKYSLEQLEELEHRTKQIKTEYENFQLVVKCDANSLYGTSANIFNSLCDYDIAEDITMGGKYFCVKVDIGLNILFKTWEPNGNEFKIIQEFYPQVIKLKQFTEYIPDSKQDVCVYGDTDSRYIDLGIIYSLFLTENGPLPLPDEDEELSKFAVYINEKIISPKIKEIIDYECENRNARKGYLKMAHEVTSRKSIFMKKKKYIMTLIWKDGKFFSQRKLKLTGVELRKAVPMMSIKPYITGPNYLDKKDPNVTEVIDYCKSEIKKGDLNFQINLAKEDHVFNLMQHHHPAADKTLDSIKDEFNKPSGEIVENIVNGVYDRLNSRLFESIKKNFDLVPENTHITPLLESLLNLDYREKGDNLIQYCPVGIMVEDKKNNRIIYLVEHDILTYDIENEEFINLNEQSNELGLTNDHLAFL